MSALGRIRLNAFPLMVVVCIIIAAVLPAFFIATVRSEVVEESYEVWDAKAPFGHYWVQVGGEGGGGFFLWHFEMWSNLQESYTIKYFEDGELRTVIFPSSESDMVTTDGWVIRIIPHIYLVNENITPVFTVEEMFDYNYLGDRIHGGYPTQIDYYLTLPDPKVFG